MGVGDAFALKRLEVPPEGPRGRSGERVREVGWAEFGHAAYLCALVAIGYAAGRRTFSKRLVV